MPSDLAPHSRGGRALGKRRHPSNLTGANEIVGFAGRVADRNRGTDRGQTGFRGNLVAVRNQKADSMPATTGAKECAHLELLAVVDDAFVKDLRQPIDGMVEVFHTGRPSHSVSKVTVSKR